MYGLVILAVLATAPMRFDTRASDLETVSTRKFLIPLPPAANRRSGLGSDARVHPRLVFQQVQDFAGDFRN
jgi:hypothetical protein